MLLGSVPLGGEAWGCPGAEEGQQEQPPCTAPRLELLGTSRPSQALDGGHTVASGGHFTSGSSGQMFPSKENISSSWVPSSSRLFEWDPKLREVPRTGMSPETPDQALPVPACLQPRCPGGRAGLPLLHPLLPRERDPAPKRCQSLLTFRQSGMTSGCTARGGELGIKGAGNALFLI